MLPTAELPTFAPAPWRPPVQAAAGRSRRASWAGPGCARSALFRSANLAGLCQGAGAAASVAGRGRCAGDQRMRVPPQANAKLRVATRKGRPSRRPAGPHRHDLQEGDGHAGARALAALEAGDGAANHLAPRNVGGVPACRTNAKRVRQHRHPVTPGLSPVECKRSQQQGQYPAVSAHTTSWAAALLTKQER